MTDVRTTVDRCEIQALQIEFTDAGMVRDYDRFASLFTEDGVWRIPSADVEFFGRQAIRTGVERLQGLWHYFVQNAHPGAIRLDGDTATGRAYIAEFGLMHDGTSHRNHSIYYDRFRRTGDGWRFTERVYEVRYADSTALPGSAAIPAVFDV